MSLLSDDTEGEEAPCGLDSAIGSDKKTKTAGPSVCKISGKIE